MCMLYSSLGPPKRIKRMCSTTHRFWNNTLNGAQSAIETKEKSEKIFKHNEKFSFGQNTEYIIFNVQNSRNDGNDEYLSK